MAAPRSPSNRPPKPRSARSSAGSGTQRSSAARGRAQPSKTPRNARGSRSTSSSTAAEGLGGLLEQLLSRIITPLGLVLLSRERIQETLDEAAERGRLTRTDANELVSLLVQRGREQTDELLSDVERLLGRGRQQLDAAGRLAGLEPFERLMRGADKARRKMGGADSSPIIGYDELTAPQVQSRLAPLSTEELRQVRDYERAHAKRKTVLAAIDKRLA